MLTPHCGSGPEVSIIPRGVALGVTFAAPETDRFSHDEQYLLAKIKVALGGRAAEQLMYGDVTSGAESDIDQLTEIARKMVGRWGMSEAIGTVALLPANGRVRLPGARDETSEQTRQMLDAEVRRIVSEALDEVTKFLRRHRHRLDALASALMERETLDEIDAYAAADIDRRNKNGNVALQGADQAHSSTSCKEHVRSADEIGRHLLDLAWERLALISPERA
jgi:cell division protease FtsH